MTKGGGIKGLPLEESFWTNHNSRQGINSLPGMNLPNKSFEGPNITKNAYSSDPHTNELISRAGSSH